MQVALPQSFLTRPIAHRGYFNPAARIPENALSAFEAAARAGYAIELDVQMSRDGQAMVFHDDSLDRLTAEQGAVLTYTAAELGKIIMTNSADIIPTLSQVLQLVAGRVPILIEIKDPSGDMGETSGRLEQATVAALSTYRGEVAVMSFNPACIVACARLAPQLARGLTTEYFAHDQNPLLAPEVCDRLRQIADYEASQSSFISHHFTELNYPRVTELKTHGAHILCWTIRTPEQEAQARMVAHNITFEGYAAAFPA